LIAQHQSLGKRTLAVRFAQVIAPAKFDWRAPTFDCFAAA